MSGIWKWCGKDEFVPGLPPRDLTEEEVDKRGIRETVVKSQLYKKVKEKDNGSQSTI